jgi:predicted SnoaL-like aldol condensation-catalyzing enzyme
MIAAVATLSLAACANQAPAPEAEQEPVSPEAQAELQEQANLELVSEWWRTVLMAGHTEMADQFMAEDYIQHNPTVATGRQPFMDFFGQFPTQPVPDTIPDLVTMIAEGDIVILAFRRELPDPRNPGETYTTTWFDMLRIEDGKLAEHWDYGTISPD